MKLEVGTSYLNGEGNRIRIVSYRETVGLYVGHDATTYDQTGRLFYKEKLQESYPLSLDLTREFSET